MHVRKMATGTETEHACSVSHCVLHLFLNSKQRTKLETVKSDGIYFRSLLTTELNQFSEQIGAHLLGVAPNNSLQFLTYTHSKKPHENETKLAPKLQSNTRLCRCPSF